MARLLLEKGADPNHRADGGSTPLRRAAFDGHTEIIKLLLEKGATPNIKGKDGLSSLGWAKGNKEIIDLLKNHGAK